MDEASITVELNYVDGWEQMLDQVLEGFGFPRGVVDERFRRQQEENESNQQRNYFLHLNPMQVHG